MTFPRSGPSGLRPTTAVRSTPGQCRNHVTRQATAGCGADRLGWYGWAMYPVNIRSSANEDLVIGLPGPDDGIA